MNNWVGRVTKKGLKEEGGVRMGSKKYPIAIEDLYCTLNNCLPHRVLLMARWSALVKTCANPQNKATSTAHKHTEILASLALRCIPPSFSHVSTNTGAPGFGKSLSSDAISAGE